jgi:hypothetical protein
MEKKNTLLSDILQCCFCGLGFDSKLKSLMNIFNGGSKLFVTIE